MSGWGAGGPWTWGALAAAVPAVICGAWSLAQGEEQHRRRARLLRTMARVEVADAVRAGWQRRRIRTLLAFVAGRPAAAGGGQGRRWDEREQRCSWGQQLQGPQLQGPQLQGPQRIRGWLGSAFDPVLLVLPLGLLASLLTGSPVPGLAAAAAVVPLRRARRRRRAAGARERLQDEVAELAAALAGELRSGATPEQALRMVAAEQGRTDLFAAARYGGDVPRALRRLAEQPGGEGAAGIAACWQVAAESGAGLAAGLDRIAEGLRAERALRESVRAELAGPRSTGVLLAGLPFFALALGASLGADPLHVLLHTPAGLLCTGAGAALEYAGLAWTARIVRTAEGGARGPGEAPGGPAEHSRGKGVGPRPRGLRPG